MGAWRRFLVVAGCLVAIAGVPLFLLSADTDRFFAWTIDPPLTAAFLGAGYWASGALQFRAAREPLWERARIAVLGVFVFTTLTLVATLVHLDRFHFSASEIARAAAWIWIGIYALVPLVMVRLFLRGRRNRSEHHEASQAGPLWLRAALLVHAVGLGVLGVALFLVPTDAGSVWPWALTPLTARAVAAWLMGIALIAWQSGRARDLSRTGAAMTAYAAFGPLQLVAVARFGSTIQWVRPGAWIYLVFLVSATVIGLSGTLLTRRKPGPA
jgi:hypothetical protein